MQISTVHSSVLFEVSFFSYLPSRRSINKIELRSKYVVRMMIEWRNGTINKEIVEVMKFTFNITKKNVLPHFRVYVSNKYSTHRSSLIAPYKITEREYVDRIRVLHIGISHVTSAANTPDRLAVVVM